MGVAGSLDQSTLNQTLVAPKYAGNLDTQDTLPVRGLRYSVQVCSSRSSTNSNSDCSSRHEQGIPILPYPACPADLADLSLSQASAFASALSAILPTVCRWGKSV
ncbi:uncharacterized protein UHOD_09004 [Ustilago sp. UG-2017b]|nr:uncharacterized protein UHOD_09004 [Ustilago sp. UG-2017b]